MFVLNLVCFAGLFVVNLFVLNLVCFVGRANWPCADEGKPIVHNSVGCSLMVAVDAGREGLGLRGEEYFRLPLYTRNGQVGEHVRSDFL